MREVLAALLYLLMLLTTLMPAMAVNPGLPNIVVPNYPEGVVLHLPFDEGGGTTAYNAINSSEYFTLTDGNTTNADGDTPPQWVAGVAGTALHFDGVDDYVQVPYSESLNLTTEITVAAWFKSDVARTEEGSGWYGGISKSSAWILGWQGWADGWSFGIYNSSGAWLGGARATDSYINAGEWYFVVGTFDGRSTKIYVNGELKAVKDYGSPQSIQTTIDPVTVGKISGVYWNGSIDEFMIFNRSLSSEEVKLLYELTKPHRFSSQPTIMPISIPVIDISTNQTVTVQLQELTTESNAYLPIPVGARNVNPANWVYTVDGDVLQFDDNRYVNATSVTFEIPLQIYTNEISTIPSTLVLDSDSKTYRYEAEVNVYNPSDIDLIGVIGIDPSDIGVATANMNGMFMAYNNGLLTNAAPIEPGHNQFKITAELPLEKKEVEFRATIDDYLNIDTFEEAVKAAESLAELKTDTMVKVITIETINFKDFGNRTVIIPLKGVKPSDIIEAKALTGSRPDIEVRKTDDGCELVIPPSAFTGELLDYNKAEIKLIYLKKPAWWEKIPFLKSLGGFFEFLKKLFGGG